MYSSGLTVKINIQLEFYYNEYDWGIIYREIGSQALIGQNNKFYKVSIRLSQFSDYLTLYSLSSSSDKLQPQRLRRGSF